MNPKPSGQPATSKTRFQLMIERLIARIEADKEPKHPGVIMDAGEREYDAGGYGDPHVDTRPEWIRRDEEGWVRLK